MLHLVSEISCNDDRASSGCGQKPCVLQHSEHTPSRVILSLTVSDPRDLPPSEAETDLETTMHGSDLKENDIQTSNPVNVGDSVKSDGRIQSLWPKPVSNGVFLSNCRHLWDSSEKLNPPVPENMLCVDRHRKRLKYFYFDPVNNEKSPPDARDGFGQSCPILLLKHQNRGNLNTVWSIVLPLSGVKDFWTSLVSHGACAIGSRERWWMACDSGLLCFPCDVSLMIFLIARHTYCSWLLNLLPLITRLSFVLLL